jgi:hypothetical protein
MVYLVVYLIVYLWNYKIIITLETSFVKSYLPSDTPEMILDSYKSGYPSLDLSRKLYF